ncbi:MAG: hypothetical protein LBB79_04205, partial [Prevotellaceae bacterium]|nr:hypothetical protein [Prevotellaceae bacterium]
VARFGLFTTFKLKAEKFGQRQAEALEPCAGSAAFLNCTRKLARRARSCILTFNFQRQLPA